MTLASATLNTGIESSLKHRANDIRALTMDAVEQAKSGHPGMPMGMADVATVLYSKHLKFDPQSPNWPDRDRFILSAGHRSMLLYALLYLTGYEDMTLNQIKNFRQLGSKTAGHPEFGEAGGIETTTGPLGQGLGNAVGMAIAEHKLAAQFGEDLVDHHTYVIAGDGCLMEGISHEACSLAGHLRLNKLVVLFDDNQISIDGPTSLSTSDDNLKRFESYGWNAIRIDGHDYDAIDQAIADAKNSDRPTLIACRTTIAFGAPTKAGTSASHGAPLGLTEIQGARTNLDWPYAPFEIPEQTLSEWRAIGAQGKSLRTAWEERLKIMGQETQDQFNCQLSNQRSQNFSNLILEHKKKLVDAPKAVASRQASGDVLEMLTPHMPELLGGSADLTGPNNTRTTISTAFTANDRSGNYIYYGIREHAMAAAMNGIALHGGFVPYSGTFLSFADYCRPSIRLAALMGLPVIHVMTHDSIGLGEDGPTHQPVEHLASLRAIPNLLVLRPCDATEVAECWEIALKQKNRPTLLALSRQSLPTVRKEYMQENLCSKGAYVVAKTNSGATPQVVLIGTGSEVSIALSAKNLLEADGIATSVVSMPSWELFNESEISYKESILPTSATKVAVEAGIHNGWERYTGDIKHFVGMKGFGASGKIADLYEHFEITPKKLASVAKESL